MAPPARSDCPRTRDGSSHCAPPDYLAARRMHKVITALSKLEIDKTTEEQLVRTVPYLRRSPRDGQITRSLETGNIDLGEARYYYAQFSNEEMWMKYSAFFRALRFCPVGARVTKEGYEEGCLSFVPDVVGYRYFAFGASVTLLNGKVSSIRYGINDRLVFPRQVGDSFRKKFSFHLACAPNWICGRQRGR